MYSVKAVAMDVDGVLTDGTFWWGPDGEEFKRFSFTDIMGVSLGRKAGLIFALISGENGPLIDRLAIKMGITDIFKNCKDKAEALKSFAGNNNINLSEICFIGDDINDLPAMEIAGLSAAPADAHENVRSKADYIAKRKGGRGAVRDIVDAILSNKININLRD